MHVVKLKDHCFEQQNHSIQLVCQVIIPELMLFNNLELIGIFQILTAPHTGL